MKQQRRPATPDFDRLSLPERGELLSDLLAVHPELVAETEALARDRLVTVEPDEAAESLEWTLRHADPAELASRAGRIYGRGYVHENEAAGEILQEGLEPFLEDLARRSALGLQEAARQMGAGLLIGLANCRGAAPAGTVLAYAGPDAIDDLAWMVFDRLARAGARLPDETLQSLPSLWARLQAGDPDRCHHETV